MRRDVFVSAIVVAGGSGSRMGVDVPKQFLPILGKPMLYYSLKAFEDSAVDEIILVCGTDDVVYCEDDIIGRYGLTKVKRVVAGGKERYDSVFAGLKACHTLRASESSTSLERCNRDELTASQHYVLIHDAARPCLSQEIIRTCIEALSSVGACTVAVPEINTICVVDGKGAILDVPDRSTLWSVQTPQCFPYEEILEAHQCFAHERYAHQSFAQCTNKQDDSNQQAKSLDDNAPLPITDDTSIYRRFIGKEVCVINGSYANIKVTTIEDIKRAEVLLSKTKQS